MAHKKAGGSSNNGRDSNSKRLGVKKYGGEVAATGGAAKAAPKAEANSENDRERKSAA